MSALRRMRVVCPALLSVGTLLAFTLLSPIGSASGAAISNKAALSAGVVAAAEPSVAGAFVPVAPARLLDTRTGLGARKAPVKPDTAVAVQVTGRGGVPGSGVSAVVLNVTVTGPTAAGHITAYADGASRPGVRNVNFVRGQTVANLVVVRVGADGKVDLFNASAGTTNLLAGIEGYYLTGTTPISIATQSLHDGVAGLAYTEALSATGGVPPYTWTASGLPAGITVSADGIISGTPSATGLSQVAVTATDAAGSTRNTILYLSVPTGVPSECAGQSCALLTPDGQTVQIPATRVGSIIRDADGSVSQVLLTGTPPQQGQVLVIAPSADAPSGLIAVADSVVTNNDGTSLVTVTVAGPADAYAEGTVQAIGGATTTAAAEGLGAAAMKPRAVSSASVSPTCDSNVTSDLYGLGVTPSLTPTVAALWKHPFFGGGGIYVGTGGLNLFQFDLDGTITVNLGISISGSATCTLNLPTLTATAPAGALGAVVLHIEPSLTLKVTGKVVIRTSVTLRCGAEYRWDQGREYRLAYCGNSTQPLRLGAPTGVDATLTGALAATVSLDDLAGITGTLTASLHAGYRPAQHPVAEVDGHVKYDLGACLACFWSGSPAHVTLISGSLLDKTLLTYDTAPAPPQGTPPVITSTQLPQGTVGQPYSARLTTADDRSGTWSISSGTLPDGLGLEGDTISGKPLTSGTSAFGIRFTDSSGLASTASLTLNILNSGASPGAIQNLDYCRQNVFSANDDNSTDQIALPFAVNYHGTSYSSLYISNNGYVVFDGPRSTYTPFELTDETPTPIIAPFFADVDTRNPGSALLTYGASPDGKTFCVNWVGVGYYDQHVDKLNNFQLLLVDRPAAGPGDFDIVFNYGSMTWETGDASGGTGGIGGTPARAGFSAGSGAPGTSFELTGSGTSGALLDGEPNALDASSQSPDGQAGRYVFPIRN